MTDLYLIAHKVRGEAAFDIAEQMPCPHCHGALEIETTVRDVACIECDSLGHWWIIPTSGHRAYPYWSTELFHEDNRCVILLEADPNGMCEIPSMPPNLPDHYPARAAPTLNLVAALGLAKPRPQPPIKRRL